MYDWAGGSEDRNYGIKRITDPRKLSELLRIILSLSVIAGALLFYSWVRSQIIGIGYESQQLQAQEQNLLSVEKNLILEEQTLKNPERIEAIARNDLGMMRLRANQVLTPPNQGAESIGPNTLALATGSDSAAGTQKVPASN